MKLFLLSGLAWLSIGFAEAADLSAGLMVVERECAKCHAIGKTDSSPNPKSPPFRDFVYRNPPAKLIEAFTARTTTAHGGMPEFILEPEEIGEIASYLESLRTK